MPVDTYILRFSREGGVYKRKLLGERVIGNLRAGQVVLQVLRVPRCHARMVNAVTGITLFDLQQLY